jgi:hypothetical protein
MVVVCFKFYPEFARRLEIFQDEFQLGERVIRCSLHYDCMNKD